MDVKPYKLREENVPDMASEPVVAYTSHSCGLDVLRHQVMDAVALAEDQVTLVTCLNILTNKKKLGKTRHPSLSDEELAAKLSSCPDWDETEHVDLSQIDYSKYQPYHSAKVIKAMEKWL